MVRGGRTSRWCETVALRAGATGDASWSGAVQASPGRPRHAATARPGPLGTGAVHAAASAPPAPRQTGSRASVVRPRSPCHD